MAVDRHFWSSWPSRAIAFAIAVGLSLGGFAESISRPGIADLTGAGFTGGTTSISNTGAATGTFTIKNLGSRTSSTPEKTLKVSFYFSTDGIFKRDGDLFLGDKFISPAEGIAENARFTGNYNFSLFQTDATDPSVRSEFVKYWAARGQVGTKVSGFIGMIIDPSSLFLDANTNNNKNQGLLKDQVAIDVTIAPGTRSGDFVWGLIKLYTDGM